MADIVYLKQPPATVAGAAGVEPITQSPRAEFMARRDQMMRAMKAWLDTGPDDYQACAEAQQTYDEIHTMILNFQGRRK